MDAATTPPSPGAGACWRPALWVTLLTVGLALLHAGVAASGLLSGDEAYYWLWSRRLQLSYFDHPGMAAWWLAATTWLLGDTELAVRLPSVLAAAAVTLLLYDTTRRAFASTAAGLTAALWLNLTLLFGAAAVTATPDAPLLVFWALALWAMVRLMRGGGLGWLLLLALALGLGFTAKYTVVLIVPGLAVTFLAFRAGWHWLRRPVALALAAALGLVCTLPVLLWNARHDWVSFRKQLSHSFDTPVADPLASLGTFLGTQAGLMTPLLFGFCLWGIGWALWAGWRRRRPDWFVLGATALPVLLFFAHHAWGGLVQPHWAGPAWLGAIAAACGGWHAIGARFKAGPRWRLARRLFVAAPVLGGILVGVAYLQMATALLPIPPKLDPLGRLGGWDRLAQAVTAQRAAHPDAFVFVAKHELSGLLSFYLPDHPTVFLTGSGGVPRIPSYDGDNVATLAGRDGLFVIRTGTPAVEDIARSFARVSRLDGIERRWGGRAIDRYEIWLGESYQPGLFEERRELP
ncbi:MAG: hypothetical protein RLZZ501_1553 [Pseudomonadota bacterium]